jgi:CubicO group peptidase (beta-lactamase class C family)
MSHSRSCLNARVRRAFERGKLTHTTYLRKERRSGSATAHYPAITGLNLRGFGWDIDTRLSTPRGVVFPIGSFGHTGFTGTTLWIDPGSDTYVVLLSNSIHLRGSPPIQELRGDVATATAQALRLYGSG